MPLSINIELSDKDIERFRAAQSASEASAKSPDEIVKAAIDLLKAAQVDSLPDFIRQRLEGLPAQALAQHRPGSWRRLCC